MTNRTASLVSQLLLGFLLAPRDFGLYAAAISITNLVQLVGDGGLEKILSSRRSFPPGIERYALVLTMALSTVGALVLTVLADQLATVFAEPVVSSLIKVIAWSMPLRLMGRFRLGLLAAELEFRSLSGIEATSALVRHSAMVALAVAGFGTFSFVLPLYAVAVYEVLAGSLVTRRRGVAAVAVPLGREDRRDVRRAVAGLSLAAVPIYLVQNGDYVVVGPSRGAAFLGVYFFAFQATSALSTIITSTVQSVLLPTLSALADVRSRVRAYRHAGRLVAGLIIPASPVIGFAARPAVELIWAGRWDAAAGAIGVLMISIGPKILSPIGRVLLESERRYRARLLLLSLDGASLVGITAASLQIGGTVTSVAVGVSLQRSTMAMVSWYLVPRLVQGKTANRWLDSEPFRATVLAYISYSGALALEGWVGARAGNTAGLILGGVFVAAAGAASTYSQRRSIGVAVNALRRA